MTSESVQPAKPTEPSHEDPLRIPYRRMIRARAAVPEGLVGTSTALLCIDMQYLDAAPNEGIFADPTLPPGDYTYYFATLRDTVLPNVARLQRCFRDAGLEVIHVRIQALTRDGRDRSPQHKRLNLLAAPGSREAQFLPEVAPADDEIILNKTASGVFTTTNLAQILSNLGLEALVVTGVYTDECVSTTVRDASDLGFDVVTVEDACTTVTRERHEFTVETLRDRYTRVLRTDEVIAAIGRLEQMAV